MVDVLPVLLYLVVLLLIVVAVLFAVMAVIFFLFYKKSDMHNRQLKEFIETLKRYLDEK